MTVIFLFLRVAKILPIHPNKNKDVHTGADLFKVIVEPSYLPYLLAMKEREREREREREGERERERENSRERERK